MQKWMPQPYNSPKKENKKGYHNGLNSVILDTSLNPIQNNTFKEKKLTLEQYFGYPC